MEEYRRWEDNIMMNPKGIGVDVVNWMEFIQDTDTFTNLRISTAVSSSGSGSCTTGSSMNVLVGYMMRRK